MMGNYHVRFGEQLHCALTLLFFMVKFFNKVIYKNLIYLHQLLFFKLSIIYSTFNRNISTDSKINSRRSAKPNYPSYKGGGLGVGWIEYKEYKPNKFEILDPFHNRSKIADVAKGAKGVYIFTICSSSFGLDEEEVSNNNICYVGSSKNLYNRVCSYFMPSILAKADRKVLRYFNKYGFKKC